MFRIKLPCHKNIRFMQTRFLQDPLAIFITIMKYIIERIIFNQNIVGRIEVIYMFLISTIVFIIIIL